MKLISMYGKFKNALQDEFGDNTKRMTKKLVNKLFPEFVDIYESQHSQYRFKDILYCAMNGIDEIPKCPICGNLLKIKNYIYGFRKTCCVECRQKYEQTEEYSNILSRSIKGKYTKDNHKYDYLFEGYNYVYDSSARNNHRRSSYILRNYCHHGDVCVYIDNALVLREKRKDYEGGYCLDCNKELFEIFEPTEEEYNNFLSTYKDFYERNHFSMDRDFWIRYYPKTFKMLIIYYKNCCEPNFVITLGNVENDYLKVVQEANYCILNGITYRPKCPYPGCKNSKVFYNVYDGYLTFCEEHKHQTHVSGQELEMYEYIKSFGLNPQRNVRGVINGCELDFYFPEMNRAIEYNGVWFHSLKVKPQGYHWNKFLKCKDSNIGLLCIWEDMWKNRPLVCEERVKRHCFAVNALFDKMEYAEIDKDVFINKFSMYSLDGFNSIIGERYCLISYCGNDKMYINYDIENDIVKVRTMFSIGIYNDNWYCDVVIGWFMHYFGDYSRLIIEEDADVFTPELLRRCGDDNYWIEPVNVKANKGERDGYNINVDKENMYDVELTGRLMMVFNRK